MLVNSPNYPQVLTEAGQFTADALKLLWDQMLVERSARHELERQLATNHEVAYNASLYSASGSMVWTVDSADQTDFTYWLAGKLMVVNFTIEMTSITGTPSTQLRIAIPAGFSAQGQSWSPVHIMDNGARSTGLAVAAGSRIGITKNDFSNWSASTDSTGVWGTMAFRVK